MKALALGILENKRIGNCSNNGISSRYDTVLLVCEYGNIEIDERNPPANAVKLVRRNIRGRIYMHLEPLRPVNEGCVGWMSGGTFATTSNAIFDMISEYPLPIHDRQETQELYDLNFR